MVGILDNIADYICSDCVNGKGDCWGYPDCPFWSEFDDIEKVSNKVEELAEILHDKAAKDQNTGMWSPRELYEMNYERIYNKEGVLCVG